MFIFPPPFLCTLQFWSFYGAWYLPEGVRLCPFYRWGELKMTDATQCSLKSIKGFSDLSQLGSDEAQSALCKLRGYIHHQAPPLRTAAHSKPCSLPVHTEVKLTKSGHLCLCASFPGRGAISFHSQDSSITTKGGPGKLNRLHSNAGCLY